MNSILKTKPIIYCSDGLCDLTGYTKSQLMLKSSSLKIFFGKDTPDELSVEISNAIEASTETEIPIILYNRSGASIIHKLHEKARNVTKSSKVHYSLGSSSSMIGYPQVNLHSSKNDTMEKSEVKPDINFKKSLTTTTTPVISSNQLIVDTPKTSVPLLPNRSNSLCFPTGRLESSSSCPSSSHHDDEVDLDSSLLGDDNTFHHLRSPIVGSRKISPSRRPLSEGSAVNPNHTINHTKNRAPYPNSHHSHGIDSEALRLVLSSHPEPIKSSVSEKFAQFLSLDEDFHVEHRFESPRMHKFTLKHYSMYKAVWDWIILCLTLYTAICTPYVTTFMLNAKASRNSSSLANTTDSVHPSLTAINSTNSRPGNQSWSQPYLRIIDIIVDVMFFIDIIINFRTTYVNKNDEVVSHPKRIAAHYIKGWFLIDLVAALPLDQVLFRQNRDQPTAVVSVLKSARLLRLIGIVRKIDRYSEYGASILILLTASFALIAHWLACIWHLIGYQEQVHSDVGIGWLSTLANQTDDQYEEGDPDSGPNLKTRYITALYFTFSSLTSVGFGNVSPNTNAEKIFSIVVMLVGSLMYASIFGNVGALIQRLYSGTARYHAQMLRIKEFIRFHQIPSPLKQRLEEYSAQVWEHTNGIDMSTVQYSFPESLQSDICLYVYRAFLGGSSAFKSLNDGCLRNISLRIRSSHMPPSDTLIHTGDLLTATYYVVKGSLEVVTSASPFCGDDEVIIGVLGPGDFFGALPPLALLLLFAAGESPSTHNHQPAPSPPPKSRFAVRALTYTDVQFIDRHDLAELCSIYTELPQHLLTCFELAMPITATPVVTHLTPSGLLKCNNLPSPHYNTERGLDEFLELTSHWNTIPDEWLSNLVQLTVKPPSRLDATYRSSWHRNAFFNQPDRPKWDSERVKRLFDHGALCFSEDMELGGHGSPTSDENVQVPNHHRHRHHHHGIGQASAPGIVANYTATSGIRHHHHSLHHHHHTSDVIPPSLFADNLDAFNNASLSLHGNVVGLATTTTGHSPSPSPLMSRAPSHLMIASRRVDKSRDSATFDDLVLAPLPATRCYLQAPPHPSRRQRPSSSYACLYATDNDQRGALAARTVPTATASNLVVDRFEAVEGEALVAKTLNSELKDTLDIAVKMVNYIKMRPIKCRQFTKLCWDMESEHSTLIQHTDTMAFKRETMVISSSLTKRPVSEQELRQWATCLLDPASSLVDRSRALWGLRHASEPLALELLGTFLSLTRSDKAANALLQHEAAYCLGQRGDKAAVDMLILIVDNVQHEPIVRHEAAEALAALVTPPMVNDPQIDRIRDVLGKYEHCDVVELAETCQIGLKRIEWVVETSQSPRPPTLAEQLFPNTVDPAPAFDLHLEVDQLHGILMSPQESLFRRYQALFTLRDLVLEARRDSRSSDIDRLGLILTDGLSAPFSALLRHEVAFVLGQLDFASSAVDKLIACVQQGSAEHAMVRHEAAEALGAHLGTLELKGGSEEKRSKRIRDVLVNGADDPIQLVRESCVLALDIGDYVASPDQSEYAKVPV